MVAVLLDAFPTVLDKLDGLSNNGETALHLCCRYGADCSGNLQELLDRGADATLQDSFGRTAEDYNRGCLADVFAKHAAWKASHRRAWMAAVTSVTMCEK